MWSVYRLTSSSSVRQLLLPSSHVLSQSAQEGHHVAPPLVLDEEAAQVGLVLLEQARHPAHLIELQPLQPLPGHERRGVDAVEHVAHVVQHVGGHLRHARPTRGLHQPLVDFLQFPGAFLHPVLQSLVGLSAAPLASLDLMGHLLEDPGELPQLVVTLHLQRHLEVPGRYLGGRPGEGQQRAGDVPPEHPVHDDQLHQQRRHSEEQHVARRLEGRRGHHTLGQDRDEVPTRPLQPSHGEVLAILRQLQHRLLGLAVADPLEDGSQVGPLLPRSRRTSLPHPGCCGRPRHSPSSARGGR